MISEYVCTQCGNPTKRDDLTVKRVQFVELGAGAKTKRSRVTHWLCVTCLAEDFDWNRDPFKIPVARRG